MIKVSLDVSGLLKDFKTFEDEKKTKVKGAINLASEEIAGLQKRQITTDDHIDTGRLRASVHAVHAGQADMSFSFTDDKGQAYDGSTGEQLPELTAMTATNVEYGPKIEELDSFMFKPAEGYRKQFEKDIKEALE